ncbi:MAG: putative DNA-binding domain-containing protein [Gammaproteobacteria bacterium]|nr:putative DNA-binding domain-containing protein [Gammaproteobacteria bacterium]MDH5308836.1 putative DNA-binding domain-containing protein [Gammaproteobacteria bacterium]
MAERPAFQRRQYEFAAHIRDPDANPPPAGIEDRRMAIYRELFYNNLLSLLGSTFPVLKKIHGRDSWRRLIRRFMAAHRSETPYFLEIPAEFVDFLQYEYDASDEDFPFLAELAHYEWAELALSVSQESNEELDVDPDGDLLAGIPVMSRLAWLCSYRYPVHRIAEDFLPADAPETPTFLVVYRKSDDDLGFTELNPVTARLLERIGENDSQTGEQLIVSLADEIGYADPTALIAHALAAMQDLRAAEIIVGVARSS